MVTRVMSKGHLGLRSAGQESSHTIGINSRIIYTWNQVGQSIESSRCIYIVWLDSWPAPASTVNIGPKAAARS
jgi:hypothetical protein